MSAANVPTTVPPDFEALYAGDPDPWRVGTSPYEAYKLDLVCTALGPDPFTLAWDLASGTGHLTRRLAARCGRVVAVDLSAAAVALTARRCQGLDHVTVGVSRLPDAPVEESGPAPDLIVLSEVLYYLDASDRRRTLAMVRSAAAPTCAVVAVHWNGAPHDAYLSGPAAQREIVAGLTGAGWHHRSHHVENVREGDGAPGFGLDILTRAGRP